MTDNVLSGRARLFARAHINTDEIIPARYLITSDAAELAEHVMEDLDPGFAATAAPDDIVVAGEDFGCGSSREHAVWALKGAGIRAVVADSFARIFFRNAINNGFRPVECPGIAKAAREGDRIEIDVRAGAVRLPDRGIELPVTGAGPFAEELLSAGGLLPYMAARLRRPERAREVAS